MICQSARSEFEAARHETDPEVVSFCSKHLPFSFRSLLGPEDDVL